VGERERDWAACMRAANKGDAAAYARLLASLAPVLRGQTRRRLAGTRLEQDVEDVVQETLLAVHLKRHTWDEARPFGPWLGAIARHKLIDAMRRRGHRVHVPVEDFADFLVAPAPDPERSIGAVDRYLDKLPSRQKDVVQALTLESATVRETAQRLSTTEGAVRVALHRGLAAIAAAVRKHET
jgi:RNA polymerase sigma-70 factor (ECF subfamily)